MEEAVDAVVDGVIRLDASTLHPKAAELLWRGLTFPNPEYLSRVRFGRWVGATPEEITLVERDDAGAMCVPRGAVGVLHEAAEHAGQRVTFRDQRVVYPPVDFDFTFALRGYQEKAVQRLVRRIQDCAVVPCGGGKTVIGAGAIARTGQPSIILVHTQDLLDQWCSTVRAALQLEAGRIVDGQVEPGVVTVATVQILTPLDEADRERIASRFGCVILDEAHHAPASIFRQLLCAFPARYRFGLTATPERADGLGPLLELRIGPVLYEISHDELVDAGHLVIPEVVPVRTRCAPAADGYTALVSALVADRDRNRLIVDLVTREASARRTVLVLSNRVAHCRALADLIAARGVAVEALTGKVSRGRRTDVLDRFRSGELGVVCATTLADEGLDVARLERLILATPARAEGRTVQRLGRLMRPHEGKATPLLYDLVDDHPMARRQHLARCRAYRRVLGATSIRQPVSAAELRGAA